MTGRPVPHKVCSLYKETCVPGGRWFSIRVFWLFPILRKERLNGDCLWSWRWGTGYLKTLWSWRYSGSHWGWGLVLHIREGVRKANLLCPASLCRDRQVGVVSRLPMSRNRLVDDSVPGSSKILLALFSSLMAGMEHCADITVNLGTILSDSTGLHPGVHLVLMVWVWTASDDWYWWVLEEGKGCAMGKGNNAGTGGGHV